jgi:hypothetical protein
MPEFRLDEKRTDPKPDRRLGIKLEAPTLKRGLGGKLDPYVPPELRYEYKPPSVFAQYKLLTTVFVALAFILLGYGLWIASRAPDGEPASGTPAVAPQRPPAAHTQPPQDQPVYVEPLPAK